LIEAHETAWDLISNPGAFWTGAQRVAIVREARASLACPLCAERKDALSPNMVSGDHKAVTDLPAVLIDFIHRSRTDPGRLTKANFDSVIELGISAQKYVEAVSVINSSVIVDTMHQSVDLDVPDLPQPQPGEPTGEFNRDAVDDGAWVLMSAAVEGSSQVGMPNAPNIARAMGLVPSAVVLFFITFRPHYSLFDLPLSISQAQAEFIASRVSALNQCFY
jgi:hypothetical protein